ncbi:hypothetical protein F5X68DRAFT_276788 [Plectosphaerella plurivora]|uniref:Uncharacterized protein n=1 Tax=Plectosphaerella plurivora TaxID=936078 RepID=A0A9P9A957_9PEZI|nr:hypothetical protein F5X68DRAFT_276788 [Plectosphaerella plurivora]
MPALTLDTESVSPRTTDPAATVTTAAAVAAAAAQQQYEEQQQQQQPAAAQATASTPVPAQPAARSNSPARPPMSPITPPLNAATLPVIPPTASTKLPPPATTPAAQAQPQATFAANRQTFTHPPIPDASTTAIPPPAPDPIDFDSNPDVLALKSAISILQLQRARATNDIRTLGTVKDAALQNPEAFVEDLAAGRIRGHGDPLFPQAEDEDSSSDDSDDDQAPQNTADSAAAPQGEQSTAMDVDASSADAGKKKTKPRSKQPKQPWSDLPRPQNIVRCPPINWSQYAVAGDSLDRLHAEQQARPSQGQPAVMGPGGTFEFRAGGENQMEFTGIAAPYTPGRDRLDKKPKGSRR